MVLNKLSLQLSKCDTIMYHFHSRFKYIVKALEVGSWCYCKLFGRVFETH